MKKSRRVQRWINEHEALVRAGAGLGLILMAVGLGVGMSRTAVMDAKEQVDSFRKKNDSLQKENVNLWRWIDAQTLAGVEFKPVDEAFYIDGQNYTC